MKLEPEKIKKIVVVRSNGIGDFVFILPALFALKETFYNAEITLIVKKWAIDFLKNRKGPFDKLVEMPPYPVMNESGPYDEERLNDFFKKMQNEKFDLAFQLQGGGRESNPFIKNLGAKYSFGCKTSDADSLDEVMDYYFLQNEVMRNLEIVGLAGAQTKNIRPKIEIKKSDVLESLRYVPDNKKEIAILHPGASDSRRRWPARNFAKVGDYLSSLGYRVVIVGSDDEKKDIELVRDWMTGESEILINKVSLGGLLGLLSRAKIFIGNDSGPRHLADTIDVPNVGLFWCINMINAAPFFRKNSRPIPSWQIDCPFCKRNFTDVGHDKRPPCSHRFSLVAKISADQVIDQINILLGVKKQELTL